jgi:hypothetical protein
MTVTRVLGVPLAVLLMAASVFTQSKPATGSIQGVWRIVQTSTSGPNSRTVDKSGPGVGGMIFVTARHFAYVDVTGDKPRPALPQGGAMKATADELRATWGPFDAQAGTYEIKGNETTQRVLVAKAPGLMQPDALYVMAFKLDGNTMTLTQVRNNAGPFPNPVTFKLTRLE